MHTSVLNVLVCTCLSACEFLCVRVCLTESTHLVLCADCVTECQGVCQPVRMWMCAHSQATSAPTLYTKIGKYLTLPTAGYCGAQHRRSSLSHLHLTSLYLSHTDKHWQTHSLVSSMFAWGSVEDICQHGTEANISVTCDDPISDRPTDDSKVNPGSYMFVCLSI